MICVVLRLSERACHAPPILRCCPLPPLRSLPSFFPVQVSTPLCSLLLLRCADASRGKPIGRRAAASVTQQHSRGAAVRVDDGRQIEALWCTFEQLAGTGGSSDASGSQWLPSHASRCQRSSLTGTPVLFGVYAHNTQTDSRMAGVVFVPAQGQQQGGQQQQKVFTTQWKEEWTDCMKESNTCLLSTFCPSVHTHARTHRQRTAQHGAWIEVSNAVGRRNHDSLCAR